MQRDCEAAPVREELLEVRGVDARRSSLLSQRWGAALACAGALVAVGAWTATGGQAATQVSATPDLTSFDEEAPAGTRSATLTTKRNASCTDCCTVMEDVSLPGSDVQRIGKVHSAASCCALCRDHKDCLAWTWVKAEKQLYSHVCFLKGNVLPRTLTKVPNVGHVSGLTHQADPKAKGALQVVTQPPGQSLYCMALIQPSGYEHKLMAMQYEQGASLFGCDEYGMYSNKQFEVAPGVWTGVVNSTLQCEMGGEFGTALNTGIFLAVWAKVISDGRFLLHDWTAKVDPDAMFMPTRLRSHLMNHLEDENGVYINNCRFGMHGPLEVFSRNAVKAWAMGAMECVEYFTELCSGMCGWGEDMFIDQCMKRKLKVRRDNDFTMLLEDHCDPPKNWDDCTNTSAVAYHPFKTNDGWRSCFEAASQASTVQFRK